MAPPPPSSAPVHHTSPGSSRSAAPPQPWHTHLTLDLLVHVLSRTLFHPFIAALLPLCLRALAAPYNSTSFILTAAFAVSVSLYRVFDTANRRAAYGQPRSIDWEEEVVVITGGLGGLGGCLAEIFALRGVSVAVLDIAVGSQSARVRDGEEQEGVRYYQCDVGDYTQLEPVWKRVVDDLGTPTILINNAAVVGGKGFLEQSREDVEKVFRINTLSHFNLSRLFLPALLDRPAGGTIVTISSVLGHLGSSNLSAYTASKAALLAYHSSLTAELASSAPQIKTILVAPGQLDTQLFGNLKLRGWWRNFFGAMVAVGEVAVGIVELIDRGEGGVVSLPAYARWIAWLGILPVGVQKGLREWSVESAFAGPKGGDKGAGLVGSGENRSAYEHED